MVDINGLNKKNNTVLCACRVEERYKKELDKRGISFTSFVRKAFEETFPEK